MDDKKEMAKNDYSRKEPDLFDGCRLFKQRTMCNFSSWQSWVYLCKILSNKT